MAQHVQLQTREGSGESLFDEWLKQNKLMKAKRKLIEHEVTMDELTELAADCNLDELTKYGKNTLGLDIMESKRFAKGVLALRPNEPNISAKCTQKIRILVSIEEKEAMDRINGKRKEIKSRFNEALKNITVLKQISQSGADEINKTRKHMIYQLNQRMDELLRKSDEIIHKKTKEINAYIKELQNMDKTLKNADCECNQLLDDTNIDMKSRKERILNVSGSVLSQQISSFTIVPTITVQLDANSFSQYIQSYGVVTNPDIPRLEIKDTALYTATIKVVNVKNDLKCAFQQRSNYVTDDDKKMNNEWKEWKDVHTVQNEDEHQQRYLLLGLKSATQYSVRAKYGKDNKYSAWSKSIHFRTMGTDCFTVNDTTNFKYIDSKYGACYHLFGKYRLKKGEVKEYRWKIKTSASFGGRYGIINDSQNKITTLPQGTSIWHRGDNICVGSANGRYNGTHFGSCGELCAFVQAGDIVTIILSFDENSISFESMKSKEKKTKAIKEEIDAVRFIVQFYKLSVNCKYKGDSEISILSI